jgi:hypothetical protein
MIYYKNKKYVICELLDISNNFTLYICKKNNILFNKLFSILFKDISGIMVKFRLNEYLHDKYIFYNLNYIFENVIIFAKINNELIGNKEEIKQHLEGLRIVNMLTQNYKHNNWDLHDDYMTNYLNFTKKELKGSKSNWK